MAGPRPHRGRRRHRNDRATPSHGLARPGASGETASTMAGILRKAPRPQHPDRQAQQKTAAPHGRTLSIPSSAATRRAARRPPPGRHSPRSPSPRVRASVASARAPPVVGGTTHRHRAPCAVFRRRGGKSVAGAHERRPAGVRHHGHALDRFATRRALASVLGSAALAPAPGVAPPARRSSSSSARSARAPRTTSTARRSSPRRPARYGADGQRDLQPPRDVGRVKAAPRARTSSSTSATATATRARTAPSASTRRTAWASTPRRDGNYNAKYYGEYYVDRDT